MSVQTIRPDHLEVKAYREQHGVGLQQAARILTKRNALKAIAEAEDLPTLRNILVEVVEHLI